MKKIKKWIPLMSELFFLALFVWIFLRNSYGILNSDTDLLWHIRQGEWLIDNKKIIIDREIFTYLFDTNNWKYLSWLSDILYAGMYRLWGFASITTMTELVIAGTVFMIFRYLCKKGVSLLISIPVILLFIRFYSFHWLPRAAIFSYFFTALWFIIIDMYYSEGKKKWLYFLPLIQILWTNIHSSFMYGYIIFFFFALSAFIEITLFKKYEKKTVLYNIVFIGFLTGAASLINPYGITYFTELNSEARSFFSQIIAEFLSVNMHGSVIENIYFVMLLFLLIMFGKKEKPAYIMLLVFWQYSGFEYVRHMALFGVMTMLILPQLIEIKFNENNSKLKKINGYFEKALTVEKEGKLRYFCIFIVMIFIFCGVNSKIAEKIGISYSLNEIRYPVKAVEYLKKNRIAGKGFNDYFAGGYMIWKFYPEKIVSMDPRATVYPIDIVIDGYKIDNADVTMYERLQKRDIKWLLITKDDNLSKILSYRKDLTEVKYKDEKYIIYALKKDKKWTDKIKEQ